MWLNMSVSAGDEMWAWHYIFHRRRGRPRVSIPLVLCHQDKLVQPGHYYEVRGHHA